MKRRSGRGTNELVLLFFAIPVAIGLGSVACSLPNRELYGHYSTCPRPDFSHATLTLSASGASLFLFGDRGPSETRLSGSFRSTEDQVTLSLELIESKLGGKLSEQALSTRYDAELRVRRAGAIPVLGPLEIGEPGADPESVAILLVRVAPLGSAPPAEVECPLVVEEWKDELLVARPAG